MRPGQDVTLIGIGTLLSRCLWAAEALARDGIDARVLEMHTVKPLDTEAILAAARETGALVTAEEHSVIGGLGAAVAETVTDAGAGVPVKRVGLADRFAGSGGYTEMLDAYGMSVADVVQAARRRAGAEDPGARRLRGRVAWPGYAWKRRKTATAFWPPKPKPLMIAVSTRRWRATLGV